MCDGADVLVLFFSDGLDWLLLQFPALRRRRQNNNERTLFELHLPQQNADVLLEGVSFHKSNRRELQGGEKSRPVLSNNYLSGR